MRRIKININHIILGLCLSFFASCTNLQNNHNTAAIIQKNIEVKADSLSKQSNLIESNLKPITKSLPDFVMEYYKREFDSELKKGEYYLFSSKKYVAFYISKVQQFEASSGWFVFLIKGEVKLSEDDFAEYHFYGIYKGDKVYTYNFLAQPVELVTELETYSANDSAVSIWGRQWDMSGSDDETKSKKSKSMLLSYP